MKQLPFRLSQNLFERSCADLPAGVYFIDGPLRIPDGVQLRGEATEL